MRIVFLNQCLYKRICSKCRAFCCKQIKFVQFCKMVKLASAHKERTRRDIHFSSMLKHAWKMISIAKFPWYKQTNECSILLFSIIRRNNVGGTYFRIKTLSLNTLWKMSLFFHSITKFRPPNQIVLKQFLNPMLPFSASR